MRKKAQQKVIRDEPLLRIVSPMCTNCSSIMNLNWGKMIGREKEERMRAARVHLNFCVKMYQIQHDAGRYFLHEHPTSATSWKEPGVMRLANMRGVMKTKAHMCRFGMTQSDKNGKALVLKPASFLTNSVCLANALNLTCTGEHRHIRLEGQRVKVAQVYPEELCRATCKGIRAQKDVDSAGLCFVMDSSSHHSKEDRQRPSASAEEFMNQTVGWKHGTTLQDVSSIQNK